jgi:hypothetical protein
VKITVRERRETATDVDVALPFYRYHDVGDQSVSEIFAKVYATYDGLRTLTIDRSRGWGSGIEWCVKDEPFNPNADTADYILGRGRYALTEEKWTEICGEFQAWLRATLEAAAR